MIFYFLGSLINAAQIKVDISPLPNTGSGDRAQALWQAGLNITFGVLGAVAVMLIVINAMKYINATGDPQKTSEAKMGVLYAVIGLAVVVLAFTLVTVLVRAVG